MMMPLMMMIHRQNPNYSTRLQLIKDTLVTHSEK